MKKTIDLCDYLTKVWDPKSLRWGWGEGLFVYSLLKLDEYLGKDRYLDFAISYYDKYTKELPKVCSSDTCSPALGSLLLYKKTKEEKYKILTDLVIEYIKTAPRVLEGSPNHFGHDNKDADSYPKSIWVDSLMMFSVFTSIYGAETNDKEMLDYASYQPVMYAKYLMDKQENLWYHSYWVKQKTHYPKRKIFWGRGNGWIITSFPMIIENIGFENKHSKEIIEIYKKTSEALLKYQREDGTFETVFNKVGKTYREFSATLLICGGWLNGIRMGILDKKFLEPALKGIGECENNIIYEEGGVFLPEISRPTVPMQIIPYLYYRIMPCGRNWNYGVASYIFACIEKDRLRKENL